MIGGDDGFLAGGEPLFVDRDGAGVGLAGGLDHEGVELHGAVGADPAVAGGAGELDVMLRSLSGGYGYGGLLLVEPAEVHPHGGGTGRHVVEAVGAGFVGERDEVGALEGNAGVRQVVAGDGVLDAPFDGARGGLGPQRRRECEQAGEGQEGAEKAESAGALRGRRGAQAAGRLMR